MKALKMMTKVMSGLVVAGSLVACGWSGEMELQQSKQYASGEVTKGGERKEGSGTTSYALGGVGMTKTWRGGSYSHAFASISCENESGLVSRLSFNEFNKKEFSSSEMGCKEFTSRGTLASEENYSESLFSYKGFGSFLNHTTVSTGYLPTGLKIRHKRGKMIDVRFMEQIASKLYSKNKLTSQVFGYSDGDVETLECTGLHVIGRIDIGYKLKKKIIDYSNRKTFVAEINYVRIYCNRVFVN